MKQIYFATTNKGKINSARATLSEFGIEVIQTPIELPEPRSDDVELIAKEKVRYAFERIQKPCIALDAGFFIESLNGFPRAFVNFALDTIGIEGMLKLAEGRERTCEFKECLAYLDDSLSEPKTFVSRARGDLSEMPRGEKREYAWSRLFLIFIPEGQQKTLAEMSYEEYQQWRLREARESSMKEFGEWTKKDLLYEKERIVLK